MMPSSSYHGHATLGAEKVFAELHGQSCKKGNSEPSRIRGADLVRGGAQLAGGARGCSFPCDEG